ncbi:Ig-like domain-containing protein [Peribacillus deserti]|uniref:Bacterial Ig domain-containing protein n=1 Tax=Peribacillus deserti TaxID=673318 RepID=A0A2N5M1D5_9BACI|nr:Ig-like domain-containing protein [Peribacillus deserti]PLT28171.1 hypothetical protein CUU66_19695 [Peribacillus deserti]
MKVKSKNFIVLMVFALMMFCIPNVNASAGTNVTGVIDKDTTWTKEGSPYNVYNIIEIAPNVKLTIEPGVVVKKGTFWVYGELDINSATLGSWIEAIHNPTLNNSPVIKIQNSNMIFGNIKAIDEHSRLILKDSNFFSLNGIEARAESIERNLFIETPTTISNAKVTNNIFYNQYTNIYEATSISKNSFLTTHNQKNILSCGSCDASNNYWGTNNEKEIEKLVNHGNSITNPFNPIFKPFLTKPDINTPKIDLSWLKSNEPAYSKPRVDPIDDNDTIIKGYMFGMPDTRPLTMYAMVGSKNIGQVTIKYSSNFEIKIPKQKADATITVYVMDEYGRKGESVTTKVKDVTPPATPTVNKVTTKSKAVTGKGEAGTTAYIYKGRSKLGQAKVDSKGNFKVTIKSQKKGTTLSVYLQDAAKLKSKTKTVKVS